MDDKWGIERVATYAALSYVQFVRQWPANCMNASVLCGPIVASAEPDCVLAFHHTFVSYRDSDQLPGPPLLWPIKWGAAAKIKRAQCTER